jgi:hypothetical protein
VADEADGALVVQEVAYAGLDALRAALPLDLCAYLHSITGEGPQLYLRAPDLSTMDASHAFDLFSSLRDALGVESPDVRSLRIAGFDALAVRSAGAASQGLFVLGRRDGVFDARARDLITGVCTAAGIACHAVEASTVKPPPAPVPVRVSASVADHVATADVTIAFGDAPSETRDGTGEGSTTTRAVAAAALAALGGDLKVGDVTDGEVAGERVVIALVHDGEGASAVAAALGGNDPLQAAAVAVLDAARRLRG